MVGYMVIGAIIKTISVVDNDDQDNNNSQDIITDIQPKSIDIT